MRWSENAEGARQGNRVPMLLVATVALLLAVVFLAVRLATSETEQAILDGRGPHGAAIAELTENPPFPLYWVGASFDGHVLTGVQQGTDDVGFIYGRCRPPLFEGGCTTPLQLQVWPLCRRNPKMYSMAPGQPFPYELDTVRGVPVAIHHGDRLEVYTSDVAIVIWAHDPEVGFRAAESLRRLGEDIGADLPPPPDDLFDPDSTVVCNSG